MSAKSSEREHDGDITHVTGVLRGLLPLLLTVLLLSFLANIVLGESEVSAYFLKSATVMKIYTQH